MLPAFKHWDTGGRGLEPGTCRSEKPWSFKLWGPAGEELLLFDIPVILR
jgi:hypothetical protein